jgi:hypothetical protein
MAQALQIKSAAFDDAPTVASAPKPVAGVQSAAPSRETAQSLPAWYLTPVAVIPFAAATFIIGNVLMMVPWSVF